MSGDQPFLVGSCGAAEQQASKAGAEASAGRPYGFGSVFPSFSPRSSGAGDTDFDWTMAEEKLLRDVARWLSPADLRRARLVCKSWCGALGTLATKAVTPPEATVNQWKGQLEALVLAFPCLQELTVGSKLSSMAAQQLGVLAGAKQLHVLHLPYGQALHDRSLLAIQPLAPHLRELRINGAASLSRRALLLLSVLANLEVLELKNCGKTSWYELQQAWRAACVAYEVHAAAEAAATSGIPSSSGGGSSGSASGASNASSSGGGSLSSKLGAWLPGGRLFRTSSPSSNSIHSAVAGQRSGAGHLLAKVHDIVAGGAGRGASGAAAVAVAQLGIGAVGNGRSSCGGASPESTARSMLHRKQKLGAAASFTAYEDAIARVQAASQEPGSSPASTSACSGISISSSVAPAGGSTTSPSGCFPVRGSPLLRLRARSAVLSRAADEDSPRPSSMLSRVGSLVWINSSFTAAFDGSSSSSFTFGSSGSTNLAAQTSSVQAALMAYLAEEEAAAAAAELNMPAVSPATDASAPATAATVPAANASTNVNDDSSSGGGSSSSSGGRSLVGSIGSSFYSSSAQQQQAQASSGTPEASVHNLRTAAQQLYKAPACSAPSSAAASPAAAGSQSRYKPRRRTTGDKALPPMPFTKLRSLSFSCSEVTLKNAGPELGAVAAISSLTCLEISKCKLPDPVFAQLRSLSRLSKLKLTGLWSMGDAGLTEVAQLAGLKSLALSGAMHVTGQGLMALTSLSGLTSLAVGLTQEVGHGALARLAAALPALQCLEVAAPSWSDLDCELLARSSVAAAGTEQQQQQLAILGALEQQQELQQPADAGLSGAPQMLWDVAAAASGDLASRSTSSSTSTSRAASSMQLLRGLRSNSSNASSRSNSLALRPPSFSSLYSTSFGSFSLPAGLRPGAVVHASSRSGSFSGGQAQGQGQQLLVLRLHGSRGLTKQGLAALSNLSELHTLLLDSCKEVPAASFISQGLLPPKLASLSLRGLPFGNLFSGCISMPVCSMHLTRLELASLEGVHEGQLRRLLSFFPRLADLSLAGCSDVGDAAMPHLPMLGRLQQLHLGGTSVTGRAFAHLAHLPELQTLVLKGCSQLCDAGLEQLLQVSTLEVLDVSDCAGVNEEGLAAVMHTLPLLVRLDVSGCKSVSQGLAAACPHYLHLQHSW